MANSFTAVLPTIIAQSLVALREQALITRLINKDFENVPQEIGDVVNVTLPSPATVTDVVPSAAPAEPTNDATPSKVAITLNQWKHTSMALTDKEVGMITAGIRPAQVTEHMRAIANFVNSFFYGLYWKIYGFAGTPGTTPFSDGTTADARAARKVLNLQLAPTVGRVSILDPDAEEKALGVADFVRADARGSGEALMTGRLSQSMGIDWFMDQLVPRHVSTPLSGGAATVNGVHAVGAGSTDNGRTGTVSIAKATATSPLVKGDILTFAGDSQTYTVLADVTLAVGNTTVSIAPALKVAKAGGEAVTLKASHRVNTVFTRDAIMFASRPLTTVENSGDTFTVADPVTGLVLRGEIVRQNKRTVVDWDILFGGEIVRPEFAARLAGA
jgi:hypothetical protein